MQPQQQQEESSSELVAGWTIACIVGLIAAIAWNEPGGVLDKAQTFFGGGVLFLIFAIVFGGGLMAWNNRPGADEDFAIEEIQPEYEDAEEEIFEYSSGHPGSTYFEAGVRRRTAKRQTLRIPSDIEGDWVPLARIMRRRKFPKRWTQDLIIACKQAPEEDLVRAIVAASRSDYDPSEDYQDLSAIMDMR